MFYRLVNRFNSAMFYDCFYFQICVYMWKLLMKELHLCCAEVLSHAVIKMCIYTSEN